MYTDPNVLVAVDKKPEGKERREDPELPEVISLAVSMRNLKESRGGRILSSRHVLLIAFDKKMQGEGRKVDAELLGVTSLLFLLRNCKEKGGGRIWSFRE